MTEQELDDLFAKHGVEVIMDVPQLTRAWQARGLSMEETLTQLLYYLGTHEERHESISDQFVDLERRQEQLRQDICEIKAGLQ